MNKDIDAVDYAVLTCLARTGGGWKKLVYDGINENIEEMPSMDGKSVQTIGRRIDTLHEHDLVESCILSSDSVKRDMIIGYKLTDDGREALEQKRNAVLRDKVVRSTEGLLTGESHDVPIKREALISIMVDAFDIDDYTRDELFPQMATSELVGLVAVHFFLDNADNTFDSDNEAVMAEVLERNPVFRRPFERKNVIARIRERLAARAETLAEDVMASV